MEGGTPTTARIVIQRRGMEGARRGQGYFYPLEVDTQRAGRRCSDLVLRHSAAALVLQGHFYGDGTGALFAVMEALKDQVFTSWVFAYLSIKNSPANRSIHIGTEKRKMKGPYSQIPASQVVHCVHR